MALTSATPSAWQALNPHLGAFHVGIAVTVGTTATYSIEVTNSDFTTVGVTPNPVAVASAQTTSQVIAINTPVRAWRINPSAVTGTLTAEAVQSGISDR